MCKEIKRSTRQNVSQLHEERFFTMFTGAMWMHFSNNYPHDFQIPRENWLVGFTTMQLREAVCTR